MNHTPTGHAPPTHIGLGALVKAAEARGWETRWYTTSVALNHPTLDQLVYLMWCDHMWSALCLQDDGVLLGDTDDCDLIEKLRRVCTWLDGWAHQR